MSEQTTELRSAIAKAKERIEERFLRQCTNGAQTHTLGSDDLAACGQFIGEEAVGIRQRGLHGTAAAIHVLSRSSKEDAQKTTGRLVRYLAHRSTIDTEELGRSQNDRNVIKTGELLRALGTADRAIPELDEIWHKLGDRLQDNVREGHGWYFYTGEDETAELLPTAYALLGLASHGYPDLVQKAEQYIVDEIARKYEGRDPSQCDSQELAVDVACLFAVTFRDRSGVAPSVDVGLRSVFKKIWKYRKSSLLVREEQNIPYFFEQHITSYVRVPWQLYLLALSSHYDFRMDFSSSIAQRMLRDALELATGHGYSFPHSGNMLSARSEAILYDVLTILDDQLHHHKVSWRPRPFEVVAAVYHSPWFIWGGLLIGGALLLWVSISWCVDPQRKLSDLGQEVIGALIVAFVGLPLSALRSRTKHDRIR